jgi:phage FluMu protein Com
VETPEEHRPKLRGEKVVKPPRTGVEDFPCEDCHESFKKKSMLQRHVEAEHLWKRPFRCTGCGKRYSRKDNARHHLKTRCPGSKVVRDAGDEPCATYASITVGVSRALGTTGTEE